MGGVFGCSSRMNGKPSSPVLRGLGASNGARLLDPKPLRLSHSHGPAVGRRPTMRSKSKGKRKLARRKTKLGLPDLDHAKAAVQPCLLACIRRNRDRKSTRLNSSHSQISYAVFCLKKKTTPKNESNSYLDRCTASIRRP